MSEKDNVNKQYDEGEHHCGKEIDWVAESTIKGYYRCRICGKKVMIEDMYDKRKYRDMLVRCGLLSPDEIPEFMKR